MKEGYNVDVPKVLQGESKYQSFFQLTRIGEPVCFNEYCCRLAGLNSVQVMLLEDWLSDMEYHPSKAEYIHPNAQFQEF